MEYRKAKMKQTEKTLFMGNEAFARGALEAGIQLATGYPGTPSSEILGTLARWAKESEIYVEWSVNEKVAFEVAYGASLTGVRAMVTQKSVGLNVASDSLMVASSAGVEGGFVVIVADDPSGHSSQNEQDSRWLGKFAEVPVLEPGDPQEAKDAVKIACELSEKCKLLVLIRSVTRVSHLRGDVNLGDVSEEKRVPNLNRDMVYTGFFAVPKHRQLHEKFDSIRSYIEKIQFNRLEAKGGEKLGIIAAGVGYAYAKEMTRLLGIDDDVAILKLGVVNPIPEMLIGEFLQKYDRIVIIEEGSSFIEEQLKVIAYEGNRKATIFGRLTGHIPREGELTTEIVAEAVSSILGSQYEPVPQIVKSIEEELIEAPDRSLSLCAGCGHMALFYAMKHAFKGGKKDVYGKNVIVCGDIGCYGVGLFPPYNMFNTHVCMGASVGIANGFSKVGINEPIFAFWGDSTFFHAGMPPLLNAVLNNSKIIVVVSDNSITAMTGHQPSPSTGVDLMGQPIPLIKVEDIAAAMHVPFVRVVDSYDIKQVVETIREAREVSGPAVIVGRRLCAQQVGRQLRRKGQKIIPATVSEEECTGCRLCVQELHCPALIWHEDAKNVTINPILCVDCGVCAQMCPADAISEGEAIEHL